MGGFSELLKKWLLMDFSRKRNMMLMFQKVTSFRNSYGEGLINRVGIWTSKNGWMRKDCQGRVGVG